MKCLEKLVHLLEQQGVKRGDDRVHAVVGVEVEKGPDRKALTVCQKVHKPPVGATRETEGQSSTQDNEEHNPERPPVGATVVKRLAEQLER